MKVKVNRVRGGSMGDQRNYGLVTGSIWNYENKPDTNRVSDTLSPVPRDKANIEAERGETIVGDLDRDGMVEHAIVGGKRHFQGGTPLNVPDGSFVFSDYTKLKIRNKELLKGIFNYSASKGVTPAIIAKRYELNKYKDILNDPESDPLDRKTAQLMLDNNMKKLGQLALVQEGMKGFPDGIPDIARPLLGTDLAQVTPSQQTPMMKKGGLVKHQTKGPVGGSPKKMTPKEMDALHNLVQRKAERKAWQQYYGSYYNTPEEIAATRSLVNLANPYKTSDNKWVYGLYDGSLPERNVYGWDHDKSKSRDKDRGAFVLNPTLPSNNPKENQARHNLVFKKAVDKYAQKMSVPDKSSSYSRQQAAGVEKANKLYSEALLSGDPVKMRKTAAEIDEKIDIPGLTTGVGAMSEFARIAAGAGATLLGDLFGFGPSKGYDFTSTEPFGLTWQEKINDMRDLLIKRADQIEADKGYKEIVKGNINKNKEFVKKSDALIKKTTDILNNPDKYSASQVESALNFVETFQDPRVLGIPSPTYWGLSTPFEAKREMARTNPSMFDPSLAFSTDIDPYYTSLIDPQGLESNMQPPPAGQETVTEFGLPAVNADVVTDVPSASATGTSTAPVKKVDTTTGRVIKPTITRQQLIDEYLKQYPNATQAELDSYVELQGFKQGGTLLKAQAGITFDLADKELEEQIRRINEANADADYEYYIERPSYTPATKIALGQGQAASAKMKSKIDPNTGFLIPEKGFKFDQKEFEKFYSDLYGNYTSPSGGTGYAAWAKDYANPATRAAAGAYRTKAINQQPLLLELEQQLKKIDPKASISQIIKPDVLNAAGVNVSDLMGIEQLTAPMIRKRQRVKPQQPAAPAAGPKTEMEGIKPPSYTGAGYYSPWTDYSLVDYYTALGNAAGVNRGMLPPFATYNPQMFDPTFLDPARAIAQQQGLTAQTQQEIGAISDPQVARANMIAAAAKAAPQVANIMADYDNRNVGIANQAAMANIAAANDARLKNIGLTDKFMERLTTREQQYENAMRDARTKVADSYKRGAVDAREWAAMNQANPNYYYDQFGNIRFRPGFNPTKDPTGSSNMLASTAKSIKDAFPSVSDDRAAELAIALMRSRSRNGVSNPMDNIWNQ